MQSIITMEFARLNKDRADKTDAKDLGEWKRMLDGLEGRVVEQINSAQDDAADAHDKVSALETKVIDAAQARSEINNQIQDIYKQIAQFLPEQMLVLASELQDKIEANLQEKDYGAKEELKAEIAKVSEEAELGRRQSIAEIAKVSEIAKAQKDQQVTTERRLSQAQDLRFDSFELQLRQQEDDRRKSIAGVENLEVQLKQHEEELQNKLKGVETLENQLKQSEEDRRKDITTVESQLKEHEEKLQSRFQGVESMEVEMKKFEEDLHYKLKGLTFGFKDLEGKVESLTEKLEEKTVPHASGKPDSRKTHKQVESLEDSQELISTSMLEFEERVQKIEDTNKSNEERLMQVEMEVRKLQSRPTHPPSLPVLDINKDDDEDDNVDDDGSQAKATTVIQMTIENVDFDELVDDPQAKNDLERELRTTIATNVGVAEDCVSVSLHPGSVKVIARVNSHQGHSKSIEKKKHVLHQDVRQKVKSILEHFGDEVDVTEPEIQEKDGHYEPPVDEEQAKPKAQPKGKPKAKPKAKENLSSKAEEDKDEDSEEDSDTDHDTESPQTSSPQKPGVLQNSEDENSELHEQADKEHGENDQTQAVEQKAGQRASIRGRGRGRGGRASLLESPDIPEDAASSASASSRNDPAAVKAATTLQSVHRGQVGREEARQAQIEKVGYEEVNQAGKDPEVEAANITIDDNLVKELQRDKRKESMTPEEKERYERERKEELQRRRQSLRRRSLAEQARAKQEEEKSSSSDDDVKDEPNAKAKAKARPSVAARGRGRGAAKSATSAGPASPKAAPKSPRSAAPKSPSGTAANSPRGSQNSPRSAPKSPRSASKSSTASPRKESISSPPASPGTSPRTAAKAKTRGGARGTGRGAARGK